MFHLCTGGSGLCSHLPCHHLLACIYLFVEKGEEREKERERNINVCPPTELPLVGDSCVPPTEDRACNPGMCPEWELNSQPFCLLAGAQSTEAHQLGGIYIFLIARKVVPLENLINY